MTSLSWLVTWPFEFVDWVTIPVAVGAELGLVLPPVIVALLEVIVSVLDVPVAVVSKRADLTLAPDAVVSPVGEEKAVVVSLPVAVDSVVKGSEVSKSVGKVYVI